MNNFPFLFNNPELMVFNNWGNCWQMSDLMEIIFEFTLACLGNYEYKYSLIIGYSETC